MTVNTRSCFQLKARATNRELWISLMMVAWIVLVWSVLIGRAIARSSGEREFPALAHANSLGYFLTTATFLVTPVVGGLSAFRLVRSAPRAGSLAIVGWHLLVLFALV